MEGWVGTGGCDDEWMEQKGGRIKERGRAQQATSKWLLSTDEKVEKMP